MHFSIHPLIQDWMHLKVTFEGKLLYAAEAISALAAFVNSVDLSELSLHIKRILGSYIESCHENERIILAITQPTQGFRSYGLCSASLAFGDFYHTQRRYDEAEDLYQSALETLQQTPVPNRQEIVQTMARVATVYEGNEQYLKAAQLSQCVLDGQKEVFGEYHFETLATLHNLAVLDTDLTRYDEVVSSLEA